MMATVLSGEVSEVIGMRNQQHPFCCAAQPVAEPSMYDKYTLKMGTENSNIAAFRIKPC
jgi:hypothetical protein